MRGPAVIVYGILWAVMGCGGLQRAAVEGEVTVNGEPLPEGTIVFVGLDGTAPSAGAAIVDGAYAVPAAQGPVAGDYQVQVRAFRRTGRRVWDGMGDERASSLAKHMVEEMEAFVPARYNDQSELRTTITAGKVNLYDIHLHVETPGR